MFKCVGSLAAMFLFSLPLLQRETTYVFVFASQDNVALPVWGQLLQETVCSHPMGAHCFL